MRAGIRWCHILASFQLREPTSGIRIRDMQAGRLIFGQASNASRRRSSRPSFAVTILLKIPRE